jgi:hypothetical protein
LRYYFQCYRSKTVQSLGNSGNFRLYSKNSKKDGNYG